MSKHLVWCLAAIWLFACTMDDEDRCLDGYEYDKETMSCLQVIDVTCMWDDCTIGAGDCDGCDANSCLANPLASDTEAGFCTIADCEPADCPIGYKCCDCSEVDWVVACLNEVFTTVALAQGCTCL